MYSFDTTSSWVQIGDDIDGEAEYDYSGSSVSLSNDGTTIAIGADYNSRNGSSSGHVRVYSFDSTSWVQIGDDIDGEAEYDGFGVSISLSDDGTTIAIGADYNSGNGYYFAHVRVYLYTTRKSVMTLMAKQQEMDLAILSVYRIMIPLLQLEQ